MSKILVLGRTMDMGGTEVAMAALLQKLVEKKEDVNVFLLVEKRGVLLEPDSEGSGSAPDDLEQKTASGFGTDCGKTGDTGRTVFLCQRNGRISDARRVWKERYGKLYERILECVEPETKQYDLVFDFFGFGAFTTAFGARRRMRGKSGLVPRRKSLVAVPDQGLYSGV